MQTGVLSGADRLEVTIDDGRNGVPAWREALGWIVFTPDGTGRSIHLSLASADSLLRRTPSLALGETTIAAHDMMVGRALGRALAHELGHYYLKSKAHESHGLMRATWPSDEPFAVNRRGFELRARERDEVVGTFMTERER